MKVNPDVLYHYTSVEALAMILSTKKFRLSPLSALDDLQEEQTTDVTKIGKTVFVSSWTDDTQESIPMWNIYSKMESGVRITAGANMFETGVILNDNTLDISGYAHFNDNRLLFPPDLNKVIYTDDMNKIVPKIVSSDNQRWSQKELGIYKNKVWKFQNEWRYIVRMWPGKNYENEDDAETIYDKFSLVVEPYIYLNIKPKVFECLEVTLSPKISMGNRVIVDALKDKYCPNLQIHESALKKCIR